MGVVQMATTFANCSGAFRGLARETSDNGFAISRASRSGTLPKLVSSIRFPHHPGGWYENQRHTNDASNLDRLIAAQFKAESKQHLRQADNRDFGRVAGREGFGEH